MRFKNKFKTNCNKQNTVTKMFKTGSYEVKKVTDTEKKKVEQEKKNEEKRKEQERKKEEEKKKWT